jgi:integrase
LPQSLAALLKAQRPSDAADTDLVFPSENNTIISNRNLWRQLKSLLKQAGLPETITLHTLRHTCATMLLDAGESVVNVAELLGHKNANTTLGIYAHVVKASQARGVEDLSRRLLGDEEG